MKSCDGENGIIRDDHCEHSDAWTWITSRIQTLDATGGIKPFPAYDFLENLVAELSVNRITIVAKSRQMLATWTVCAWILYCAIYNDPGIYLLLSKGARDTSELVKRLKLMVACLPETERDMLAIKASCIEVTNGSRILALPATEDAVRMHSPAAVFWDEMAFTAHSEAIWASVKPAIDSGGGFVGVSTPNGTDNIFYQLFTDEENGFCRIRVHWTEHPERDESWKADARKGLSEARWRQEYEVDFNVLADRVYDEFDAELHVLKREFTWQRSAGRTYRAIDFGYRHPYVIWVHQSADGRLTVFDEWEGHDATIEELAEAVARIDARHGVNEDDVHMTACDPAGASVTDTGLSAVDRLRNRGMKLVWRTSEVMTGIELVKTLLLDASGRTGIHFSPAVKRTLHHLQHYRWHDGSGKPSKDEGHDHAMDALRYLVVNLVNNPAPAWSEAKVAGVKWRGWR